MRCCSSPRRDAACWGMMGGPLEKPAEAAFQQVYHNTKGLEISHMYCPKSMHADAASPRRDGCTLQKLPLSLEACMSVVLEFCQQGLRGGSAWCLRSMHADAGPIFRDAA